MSLLQTLPTRSSGTLPIKPTPVAKAASEEILSEQAALKAKGSHESVKQWKLYVLSALHLGQYAQAIAGAMALVFEGEDGSFLRQVRQRLGCQAFQHHMETALTLLAQFGY
jgi:hypothetical protein